MTIDRIGSGPVAPIGGGASPAVPLADEARALATSVVAGVTGALGLDARGTMAARAYPVRETADAIATRFGATPAQAGEIERTVERLAGAIAADMAARADGRTLDRIDDALVGSDVPASADAVIAFLERAAEHIETAGR
ncbi:MULTISPECIES: hypothetical protein [unclassified Sphingomonas]|jgi:hypothetical protein|uniref:hypothetical protein n=1 Tax=unclassified Sphingomonas TaxID=196159 RepID=UPI00083008A9|nr:MULTISPECIES: hypothetical protein [unclassified Sphingomonas]